MKLVRPVLIVAALAGCIGATRITHAATHIAQTPACTTSVPHTTGSPTSLVAASNTFGYRLLKLLARQQGTGNAFISPLSIELALAMAYNGSGGSTSTAMARALGFGTMNRAAVRAGAAALLAQLPSNDPRVRLEVANSLWARTGFPFQQSFINQTQHDFAARVANLDFASPSAPATINSWVSCATHGTIKQIVGRIPSYMVMFLVNTVYFNGAWSSPFLSRDTREQPFTTSGGKSVTVPMMHQNGTYSYMKGQHFQAISLPYGTGRFAMTVILPDAGVSPGNVESQLTPAAWQRRQAAMKPEYGSLALPRFTIGNSFDLKSPLSTLGMAQAFRTNADFANLCKSRCKISQVLHKTYLRVYEEGTEASAVTSVGVGATAVQTPRFSMVVDHPFYLAIRDTQTGSTLFLGAINNPQG